MAIGNLSVIGSLSGLLLLVVAAVLALRGEHPAALPARVVARPRFLYAAVVRPNQHPGISDSGADSSASGTSSDASLEKSSIDSFSSGSSAKSGLEPSLADSSGESSSSGSSAHSGLEPSLVNVSMSTSFDQSSMNSGSDKMFTAESSGSVRSLDNAFFGGNHYITLAPAGAVGIDYVAYVLAGILGAFYAWLYYDRVVKRIAPLEWQDETGEDDFEFGFCECWNDPQMFWQLVLPCCLYARQAHTNQVTGICGFWPTYWLYFLTGFCCGIGPCCLTVFFRMRLKDHMGIDDDAPRDLCFAWLCAPCAIGQQAMAVDYKIGYEVDPCSCSLRWQEKAASWSQGYLDDGRD